MRHFATAVSCLLLAGCGSSDPGPTVAEEEQPDIDLTVEVSEGKGTPRETWSLRCDPDGGDHPNVAAACDALRDSSPKQALRPIPEGQSCTMIYGGPQVATVFGTWGDERVDARIERRNGCEIARWDNLEPVLPDVGASN